MVCDHLMPVFGLLIIAHTVCAQDNMKSHQSAGDKFMTERFKVIMRQVDARKIPLSLQ